VLAFESTNVGETAGMTSDGGGRRSWGSGGPGVGEESENHCGMDGKRKSFGLPA
jgi:hypothetical protein